MLLHRKWRDGNALVLSPRAWLVEGLHALVVIIAVINVGIRRLWTRLVVHKTHHIVCGLTQALAEVILLKKWIETWKWSQSTVRFSRLHLRAAKPPLSRGSGEGRIALVYGKVSVIVSPIVARLEEVGSPIVPLKRTINIVWKAPQRNILKFVWSNLCKWMFPSNLWILVSSDMGLALRIKLPVFGIFEEINLAIPSPDKGSVNIARYTREAIFDILKWQNW